MLASIIQKVDYAITWIKLCSAHKWKQNQPLIQRPQTLNFDGYGKCYFCWKGAKLVELWNSLWEVVDLNNAYSTISCPILKNWGEDILLV